MSEEYMKENNQVSPTGIIKEFMSSEYTKLGRKTIDGVEAEGIEIKEPGFYGFESTVGRLWIDIETNLPVRMEIEGIMRAIETTITTYDYNWDAELDQSIFQLNIPDDYTLLEQ
jgi:outer membrane lipoprotein-sorting protein